MWGCLHTPACVEDGIYVNMLRYGLTLFISLSRKPFLFRMTPKRKKPSKQKPLSEERSTTLSVKLSSVQGRDVQVTYSV